MAKAQLTEHEFRTLVNQYDIHGEQIKLMQEARVWMVESFGITKQAFNARRKSLWL